MILTRNQIDYLKLLETKRHNLATTEINRQGVEVELSKASESARHNREAERAALLDLGIRSRATDIEQQKANANDFNAQTNRYNYQVNLRNAQTNARNAAVNERNAVTNERNASTNWYNAESQRMQAQAAQSQAMSSSRQAAVAGVNALTHMAELYELRRHALVDEARKERETVSEIDLNSAKAAESAARTELATSETNLTNARAATEWQDWLYRPADEARQWLNTTSNGFKNLAEITKLIPMTGGK